MSLKNLSPLNGRINAKVAVFIAAPFVGLAALLFASGQGQLAPAPVAADVAKVDVQLIRVQDQYRIARRAVGRIEPQQESPLGFELAGTLEAASVDEGEQVAKGQILATLDTQRLDAEMTQMQASLTRAQADARLAELSEKRIRQVVAEGLESPQRLDEVREATVSAKARALEIEAGIERVEVELNKSKLYAPFEGTVLARQVDPGSVIAMGQPVFTLQQSSALEARIALGADDAKEVFVGQDVTLMRVDNLQPVSAVVRSIAKARALDTRTVDVMLTLQNPEDSVVPGDLVSLQLDKTLVQSGAWVPRSALSTGIRGLWNLYVIDDSERVSARAVEILYSDDERAFVRGALQSNDRLVMNGTHRLVPEQLVQVRRVVEQVAQRR